MLYRMWCMLAHKCELPKYKCLFIYLNYGFLKTSKVRVITLLGSRASLTNILGMLVIPCNHKYNFIKEDIKLITMHDVKIIELLCKTLKDIMYPTKKGKMCQTTSLISKYELIELIFKVKEVKNKKLHYHCVLKAIRILIAFKKLC